MKQKLLWIRKVKRDVARAGAHRLQQRARLSAHGSKDLRFQIQTELDSGLSMSQYQVRLESQNNEVKYYTAAVQHLEET